MSWKPDLKNTELSPNHQYLLYLIENDSNEAEKFEARYSPYPNQPIETYRNTLIKLGYMTSSGLINKLKKPKNEIPLSDLTTLADELRLKFKGKKVGSMGDKMNVIKKLSIFMNSYPEYGKEIILKATDRYIKHTAKDNYKYIMQLDYFISKLREDGKTSMLASICEEVVEGVDSISSNKQSIRLF